MGKRRHGLREGYTEYRYGEPRKARLPEVSIQGKRRTVFPVFSNATFPGGNKDMVDFRPRLDQLYVLKDPAFSGKSLDEIVKRVADALTDWKFNAWERESSTLEGLRLAILAKHGRFQDAEVEAIDIIRRAYNLLRRGIETRPVWSEGQRSITNDRDQCLRCNGPIPDDRLAAGKHFCSDICAESARVRSSDLAIWAAKLERAETYYIAQKRALPARRCEHCNEPFQPANAKTRFCSPTCAGRSRPGVHQVKRCANCNEPFKPKTANVMCCSIKCAAEYRVKDLPRRECEECREPFQPTSPTQRFCSGKCSRRHGARRRRAEARAARETADTS